MGLVEELGFSGTIATFDFVQAGCRVQKFVATYQGRIADRPRMQAHGANPVTPYKGALHIDHEGLLVGPTPDAVIALKDALNEALDGRLDAVPILQGDGTLQVRYAGWTETASVDVAVESHQCELNKDNPKTAPYMISWVAFTPYALGDVSGDLYRL